MGFIMLFVVTVVVINELTCKRKENLRMSKTSFGEISFPELVVVVANDEAVVE